MLVVFAIGVVCLMLKIPRCIQDIFVCFNCLRVVGFECFCRT